jgi:GNAT superfamily N-acetyltransferase
MFYRAMVLTNAVLGLLGIGLSYLQRRRNRVYFWLMFGSGILLVVPLVQYFFGQLAMLCGYKVYIGYQALTLEATAYLSVWGRWVAYALLFGGMLDLVRRKLEPAMTENMMLAVAEFKASPGALADLGERLPEPPTHPSERIEFKDASSLPDGLLEELLAVCSVGPSVGGAAARQWQDELHRIERDVSGRRLRDAGAFVTYLDDTPIGYGSPHLTESPGLGFVGFNCIVPEYRSRGYGRMQLGEIVRRLEACGVERIEATTSLHPFFLPARRMYVARGFKESGTHAAGHGAHHQLIDYIRTARNLEPAVTDTGMLGKAEPTLPQSDVRN